jgi:cytochrome b
MNTLHSHAQRIWDLPTRLFHLLLVVCVLGLILTGEFGIGGMQLHFWFGYAVFSLVLFRVVWGFIGGHWSRFTNFVPTPSELFHHLQNLRKQHSLAYVGHNPLGAISVLAMLLLLLVQVVTGFMSDDEIATSGPWAALVPNAWVSLATQYHGAVGKVLLIVLIGVHVATVFYYKRFKNNDLITPMISGDKPLPRGTQLSRDSATSRLFALGVFIACSYVVYRFVYLA